MSNLFDLLSLFYVFIGIRSVRELVKHWREFTDDDVTLFDRRLANQLAFFIFIPVGVLFHELGHAAATYQMGGTINWLGGGFHYALFWGYVEPLGDFSARQDWWIALAGNLVSVVYGFLPLLLLPFVKKGWIKYTIVTLARIQLGWSLVGYPLITLTGIDSDWRTIYSPGTFDVGIPLFVFHVALVISLWLIDRSAWLKRWELSLFKGAGEQMKRFDAAVEQHFDKASRSIHMDRPVPPAAVDALLARGNFYASHGEFSLAQIDYRSVLAADPQNVRALYNTGQIHLMQKHFGQAEKAFRAALGRAPGDPQIAGRLHYGLAMCLYHRGKAADSIPEFDQAIARVPDIADFYYWRGLARRQTRDNAAARNDFNRAAALAGEGNPALAQQAREMLASTP